MTRLAVAVGNDLAQQPRIIEKSLRALAHWRLLAQDAVDHRLLAVQAANPGAAATFLYPGLATLVRVHLMQLPDRTLARVAGIAAANARRIGRHSPDLVRHRRSVLAQGNRVAIGLGHLLAVETRHARGLGQQRARLDENHLASTFEIAAETLTVRMRKIVHLVEQQVRALDRRLLAVLLKTRAQFLVAASPFRPQLAHCLASFFFETRLAPIEVVEAARDFARKLDMRHLILTHRHLVGAIDQDVGRLQQRIAEETIGRQILVLQLLLLILVGRHPLQPAQRRHHR